MGEGFPIKPGSLAAEMADKFDEVRHDPEAPMDVRRAAADNYRDLTCSFEEEFAVDPRTGEAYVSRSASGLVYSGPDDLIGHYDF